MASPQLDPAVEAALRHIGAIALAVADGQSIPTDSGVLSHTKTRHTELLTIPEACAQLRISRWKVYELIRANTLNTVAIGRRRLVPASTVQQYIANQLKRNDNNYAGALR
ncbi:DNA-binding protein [Mycobacteroides abscessus]|nr:DNA-binding protein [Mycobacteroides abscessus]